MATGSTPRPAMRCRSSTRPRTPTPPTRRSGSTTSPGDVTGGSSSTTPPRVSPTATPVSVTRPAPSGATSTCPSWRRSASATAWSSSSETSPGPPAGSASSHSPGTPPGEHVCATHDEPDSAGEERLYVQSDGCPAPTVLAGTSEPALRAVFAAAAYYRARLLEDAIQRPGCLRAGMVDLAADTPAGSGGASDTPPRRAPHPHTHFRTRGHADQ